MKRAKVVKPPRDKAVLVIQVEPDELIGYMEGLIVIARTALRDLKALKKQMGARRGEKAKEVKE